MALLKVYAIRDAALDAYGLPIFVPAPGIAARSFQDQINNPDSVYGQHPEDYDLYFIGHYETDDATLIAEKSQLVMRGKDVVRPRV